MARSDELSRTTPHEPSSASSYPPPAPPPAARDPRNNFRVSSCAAFALLAFLYAALRLWRLTDSCLWFDEIFGVHAARHTWGSMLDFVARDLIHPPLFYVLLKVWIGAGGESLAWLRLFPVIVSVAALVPFFLLARELRLSPAATNLALALLALSGSLIKYAQEVRMYSLLFFFATASFWLFVRFCRVAGARDERKTLLALFVVNLLLVYTHYFGWFVVASECVYLTAFARKKLPAFAKASAALVVCFAPWVYAVVSRAASVDSGGGLAQNIGWAARPTFFTFVEYYATLNELLYYQQSSHEPLVGFLPATTRPGLLASAAFRALLFGLPVALLAREMWGGKKSAGEENEADEKREASEERETFDEREAGRKYFWPLVVFAVLPVALAFAASWMLPHSVWGARHLIVIAAPYALLVGVALARLRPAWLKATVLLVIGCWALIAASMLAVRRDGVYVWCAWEKLTPRMVGAERTDVDGDARTGGRVVKVYAFEDLVAYHTWFALSSLSGAAGAFEVEVVKGLPGLPEDPAYFLPRGFDGIAARDVRDARGESEVFAEDFFWVAFRATSRSLAQQPLKTLSEKGYVVGEGFELKARGRQVAFLVPVRRR